MIMISCVEIWNNRNEKTHTEDKLMPFIIYLLLFFTSCETSKVPPWPLEKRNKILDVIRERFPMALDLWSGSGAA